MFRRNRPRVPPAAASAPPSDNNNERKPHPHPQALVFHCQLAHGSPTVFISGFTNVRELYTKIAQQFDIEITEILYCTLNTYKLDMTALLASQIGLEDFIFAHRRGRAKEVELTKSEDALGLTITDNGNGFAFIKRIKDGSIVDRIQHISVGDHIEKLDGQIMVGKRHHEVARVLKEIPLGATFIIRLVEPLKTGFNAIGPNARVGKTGKIGSGKETLRFKADGKAEIEEKDDSKELAIDKINEILDVFLGINDAELASQIYDQAEGKTNSMDFAEAIDGSDLEELGFSDDFIIEMWGAITDARSGRLKL